jgi:hypothetical protein
MDKYYVVARAKWLLSNFGSAPNFLRVVDRVGNPRHVISLIETIHVGTVTPFDFANGFDRAADRLLTDTGYRVGFHIDPTSLPPSPVPHNGPTPEAMRETVSVVGVNPFNITSQSIEGKPILEVTESERLAYARFICETWVDSGLPFIAPVIPGYDARLVFRGSPTYGFNSDWLKREQELGVEFGKDGLCFDYYNAYTEGAAIPPTIEDGDRHLQWAKATVAANRARWES